MRIPGRRRRCTTCADETENPRYCPSCTQRYARVRYALTTRYRTQGPDTRTLCTYCNQSVYIFQIDPRYYTCYNCAEKLKNRVYRAVRSGGDPIAWLTEKYPVVEAFLSKLRGRLLLPTAAELREDPTPLYGPITDCPPVDLGPLCPPIDGIPEED